MNRGGPDLQEPGSLRFAPGKRPEFRPQPGGRGAEAIDPDCCTDEDCPQRDVNRALALLFEKLTQAYAAWFLLQEGVGRVWEVDHEGHTVQCSDPKCEFGRSLQAELDVDRRGLEQVAINLFRTLAGYAAFDLEGEWSAFTAVEVAGQGVRDERLSGVTKRLGMEALRNEVVGFDALEFRRWFGVPGGPNGGGRAS